MANFRLTERSDGTVYLQCRCGELGQPCPYQGEVAIPAAGTTLMRQAKIEAFAHCWHEHKIPAYRVRFEIVEAKKIAAEPANTKPFLVTTEPQPIGAVIESERKAGNG